MIKQKQIFPGATAPKNEVLKAGTVLVPKPQYAKLYRPDSSHTVTIEEEKIGATLGEKWMISVPVTSTSRQ